MSEIPQMSEFVWYQKEKVADEYFIIGYPTRIICGVRIEPLFQFRY